MIKIEGIDYENLKQLFEINNKVNPETIEMFKILEATVNQKGNDILFLYSTSKEADKDFKEIIINMSNQIEEVDKQKRIFKFKGRKTRYLLWSISQLKKVDGYMFKEIKFK